jgi:hypothetical protein
VFVTVNFFPSSALGPSSSVSIEKINGKIIAGVVLATPRNVGWSAFVQARRINCWHENEV